MKVLHLFVSLYDACYYLLLIKLWCITVSVCSKFVVSLVEPIDYSNLKATFSWLIAFYVGVAEIFVSIFPFIVFSRIFGKLYGSTYWFILLQCVCVFPYWLDDGICLDISFCIFVVEYDCLCWYLLVHIIVCVLCNILVLPEQWCMNWLQ